LKKSYRIYFEKILSYLLKNFIVYILKNFIVYILKNFIVYILKNFIVYILKNFIVYILKNFVVYILKNFVVYILKNFIVYILKNFIVYILKVYDIIPCTLVPYQGCGIDSDNTNQAYNTVFQTYSLTTVSWFVHCFSNSVYFVSLGYLVGFLVISCIFEKYMI
jgi:hypothetical protein